MFYVTVTDAGRVGFLAGPYVTRMCAEGAVAEAKRRANEADPFAHFYAYGVSRWKGAKADAPKSVFGKITGKARAQAGTSRSRGSRV